MPALDTLIHEAEEARLQAAVLEATGDELLERARTISQAVEERVAELAAAPGDKAERLPWLAAKSGRGRASGQVES